MRKYKFTEETNKPDPNWKDICAKCIDGDVEPQFCAYYGEPNGCNSPIYGEHHTTENSSAVGNAAAMREALEHIEKLAREFSVGNYYVSEFPKMLLNAIRPALAATPRNCDKFDTKDTAREAFQKLRGHRVWADVSLWDDRDEIEAFFDWLFATKKGVSNGSK